MAKYLGSRADGAELWALICEECDARRLWANDMEQVQEEDPASAAVPGPVANVTWQAVLDEARRIWDEKGDPPPLQREVASALTPPAQPEQVRRALLKREPLWHWKDLIDYLREEMQRHN